MNLFEQFETDSAKECDGVTVDYGKNKDGTVISFVLSNMGKSNKGYVKLLSAKLKPYQRQIDMKTVSNDLMEDVLKDVFVGSILKGWQNVQGADGIAIPFNKENALELFNKLPRLYDALNANANDISLFRVAALENEAGN